MLKQFGVKNIVMMHPDRWTKFWSWACEQCGDLKNSRISCVSLKDDIDLAIGQNDDEELHESCQTAHKQQAFGK